MINSFIICVVDDDDIYKFTITRSIEFHKLVKKILMFSDGEEALNFLTRNVNDNSTLPDIIFLDINMPVMDGFQFMEEYSKLKPYVGKKVTIYMITSSVDPVDIDRAKQIGEISDYIIKPVDPDQLSAIVDTLEKEVITNR